MSDTELTAMANGYGYIDRAERLARKHWPDQQRWAFIAPPTWPAQPEGFFPPPGWIPDPAWSAAPTGWQLWQQRPGAEHTEPEPTLAKPPPRGHIPGWVAALTILGALTAAGLVFEYSTGTGPVIIRSNTPFLGAPVVAPAFDYGPDASKSHDKGLVVMEFQERTNVLDQPGGRVRIKNDNVRAVTAVFTITCQQNGSTVATLQGSVNGLAPGDTASAELADSGQDAPISGTFSYQFQVDTIG